MGDDSLADSPISICVCCSLDPVEVAINNCVISMVSSASSDSLEPISISDEFSEDSDGSGSDSEAEADSEIVYGSENVTILVERTMQVGGTPRFFSFLLSLV